MNDLAVPWLSVVVPAFNEQKLLAGCLASITSAVTASGLIDGQWELIVCDNASTDATPRIAAQAGARVVHENRRQIARARNSGARCASGQWLLFVDADTHPDQALMRETLWAMRHAGVCGGGAKVASNGASTGVRVTIATWNLISRVCTLAAGGYLFCRRQAFIDLGGFSDVLYAGEEIDFSRRLKHWAREHGQRFYILRGVEFKTSMRKVELYKTSEIYVMFIRGLLRPRRMLRDKNLLGLWYDGRR